MGNSFPDNMTLLDIIKTIIIVNSPKQKSKNYEMLLTGSRLRSCQT